MRLQKRHEVCHFISLISKKTSQLQLFHCCVISVVLALNDAVILAADDILQNGPFELGKSGNRLNIKMSSYQYRDLHVKDKTVSWLSYL